MRAGPPRGFDGGGGLAKPEVALAARAGVSSFTAMWTRLFGRKKVLETPPEEPVPVVREPETRPEREPDDKPWIGVDLDGTLARATPWQGMTHIGAPVPLMVRRVREWTKRGLTVKIVTARAPYPEAVEAIKKWLVAHGMPELEVTNAKDFGMVELWDDRAIQVVRNTGKPFLSPSIYGRPKAPILPDEAPDETFYLLRAATKAESEAKPTE